MAIYLKYPMECFGECEKFWKIFATIMLILGIVCVIAGSVMVAQNKQNVYHFSATSHQAKYHQGNVDWRNYFDYLRLNRSNFQCFMWLLCLSMRHS
ncbi:hypothetical protein ACTXT7_011330 [Hymenolepis weldensis]